MRPRSAQAVKARMMNGGIVQKADQGRVEITDSFLKSFYMGKRVLVTGGLGFLGSSVANQLSAFGAHIVILDSLHPLYGGNRFNLDPAFGERMRVVIGDVRDKKLVEELVESSDIIYHFAAQVSYIDSGTIPFEDLEVNQTATLNLLESCRRLNTKAKVLFASSRLVLGETQMPEIREDHPTNPLSIYGVHKLAAEKYLSIYYRNYGIPTTILRITNPYGPRQQIKHGKYSVVGWFVRLAMEGKEITIFGDGRQMRNYIYIDDIVEAFIRCGATSATDGQLYLLGSCEDTEFRTMTRLVVQVVGRGSIRHVGWPENYERAETGGVVVDISKLRNAIVWEPKVPLLEGISRTFEYYSEFREMYVDGKS
jgi:UDP-glucose 4-epimerase